MSTGFERVTRHSIFAPKYKYVHGEGPVPADLMLIGERPGEKEAVAGRPFVGPAGEMLDTLLAAANLDRKRIYISNLVKHFAGYAKPSQSEIKEGWLELMEEIEKCQPRVIALLGGYAVEALLKEKPEMEKLAGVPVEGWFTRRDGTRAVFMPLMHPAAGIHSPASMPAILDGFLRLAQLLDGEIRVRRDEYQGKERYELLRSIDDLPRPCTDVAIDCEGTRNKPLWMQASWEPGHAVLIDLKDESAVKIFRRWLAEEHPRVVVHNYLGVDAAILRSAGVELADDQIIDTMVMAYELNVEPQGLKSLVYRHCGMEQRDYAEMVEETSKEKALQFVMRILEREWPAPEPTIVLDKGLPKVYKPQPIHKLASRALNDLAADKRDKDGEPVDLRKRWGDWADEVKAPVLEEFGGMPVATLEDVPDQEAARTYALRDADSTLRLLPCLDSRIQEMDLRQITAIDHAILPLIERMQITGIKLAPAQFWDEIERQCDAQMHRSKYEVYKLTGQEINPASGDQVAALLYDQLKLKPPKMTESGARGQVNDVALEQLLADAPVVQPILGYKEAQKIKGTYVQPLRKLAQQGDGRVRAELRVTRTTTGRMSIANPPLHQIPIMTELGIQTRGGFVAEDGYVIGDWDLDQIEMRLCAHESQDRALCQFFLDGKDIHKETAGLIFGVSANSIDKGDVRRTAAKRTGFGIINGITEHGLLNQMILNRSKRPDGEMWTLDDCAELIREWFKVYPGVKKMHEKCIEETKATGLARESVGGKLVYLPQVWHPYKWVRETAERMSYVIFTQGGAASLVKRGMAQVWKHVVKAAEFGVRPLCWVHDELMLEVSDDECIKAVVNDLILQILSTTVKLRVPVTASGGFGRSWREAHS